MKKINFNFRLLILIGVLIMSINQVWAYWYLPANIHYAAWSVGDNQMDKDNQIVFYAVPAGTYYFSLSNGTNPSGDCIQNTYGNISDSGYQTQEQAGSNTRRNWITVSELSDVWFSVKNESTWKLDVSTSAPTVEIKYQWNGGDWAWSNSMSSNGDGTFTCVGQYGGTSYNKIKRTQNHNDGVSATATIDGATPSTGDMCVFTYKADDGSGTLTIRKCNNVTPTNYIFFDNSASSLTRTHKYFVMGRPVNAGNATSKTYELDEIEHTQLWLHTSATDTWSDANYFAVLGSDTYFSNGNWYTDNLQNASEYSAPHLTHYNMEDGHNYIVYKADNTNGTPISINENGTSASAMNTTQTIKFSISRDGGTTYAEQTSGVTPAQITISAYKFVNGTYNSVTNTSNSSSISVNQTSTYSTSVDAAYTGATSLSYTSMRDGYTYIGWYDAASGGSSVSSPCYPRSTGTIYARFWAHRYTIAFNANDAQYSDAPAATGSTASISNVVYDQDQTLTTNGFSRAGYEFAGWTRNADGTGDSYDDEAEVNNLTSTDNATVTLYAQWTPVALTFKSDAETSAWGTASNWVTTDGANPGCVPTSGHDVTIKKAVTVSGAAVAKSVAFDGGSLTIASDGVLEVDGTIDNSTASNIVINTTSSSQGALICNLSSAPAATVNMTLDGDDFQLIASPTGGASVSSQFAGEGVYTFAWIEGKGWERRGYYDSFIGEAILVKGASGATFSGTLSNICGGGIAYSATPTTASAQGVNMLMNPLTAPIKIASMTISGSEDGSVHLWNGSGWVGKAPGSAGDAVIPAMQGYGVIASSGGGTVSFDYDVAVRGASSKNAPLNAPKRTNSDILDHITVSVLTNGRKVDLELYENEQFTTGIDKGWEAIYMEGDGRFGEMYAVADKKMNILATPSLEGTVLGFAPGEAESYTVSFEGDGRGYYLNDVVTGESTLIDEANTYNFTSDETTNATRFVISKMPMQPTGVDEVADGSKARKQMIDGTLYIIRDGRIYDATGSLVK